MIQDLIDLIVDFRDKRDWEQFHTPENLAKSIDIEAAELLECFQWSIDEFDKEEVKEELADVIIYCLLLAHTLDVDVEKIVRDKLIKNDRRYPVSKCKGNNKKSNRL